MESLVGEIIETDDKRDIDFAIGILQGKESYDDYFTSEPLPGSIIEDIAEYDAEISKLERKLKSELIGEKDTILHILLSSSWSDTLADISEQIEQLWELNKDGINGSEEKEKENEESKNSEEVDINTELNDAFHEALEKLRHLHSTDRDTSLVTVLNNIEKINGILELPTLISTCIRTGHYQEVLILYSYTKTLEKKFPNFELIKMVVKNIQELISTKMLNGLVRLLATNLTLSSMKKILSYLEALEPFDTNPSALQQLLLTMRYKFVTEEIDSYRIVDTTANSVKEMLIKRKIECVREHVYGTISVFNSLFKSESKSIHIELLLDDTTSKTAHAVETSLALLKFINECTNFLITQLETHKSHLTESVCLQLVYCSFRLADANQNFHHLFMNKLLESNLFTKDALTSAITKRVELATRY
ncbi:Cog8 [Kluyveromyces lactis]|nr:Cog8 [Kluyveromyces lactis]